MTSYVLKSVHLIGSHESLLACNCPYLTALLFTSPRNDNPDCTLCGVPKTIEHFLATYPKLLARLTTMWQALAASGTQPCLKAFLGGGSLPAPTHRIDCFGISECISTTVGSNCILEVRSIYRNYEPKLGLPRNTWTLTLFP